MERLTERDGLVVHSKFKGDFASQNILHKLADYEDKQEQGLLIELPCKVGDTLYSVEGRSYIEKGTVYAITVDKNGLWAENDNGYVYGRLGVTVFTTEAEAESALAKMGGK